MDAGTTDSTKVKENGCVPVKLVAVGLAHRLSLFDLWFIVLRQGQKSLFRGKDYNLSFRCVRFR